MRLNIGREVKALGEDLAERAGEEFVERREGLDIVMSAPKFGIVRKPST